jgi:hypothetical protein
MTQQWRVLATYPLAELPGDDQIDALAGALPGFGVLQHDTRTQRLQVQATVDAPTIRLAAEAGIRAVRQAWTAAFGKPQDPTAVRVLTLEEHERELARPFGLDLVGYRDIAEMLGVSAQRAAQLAERPEFPPAIGRPAAGPVFTRDSIEAWERTWERKGGRPRKAAPEA